MSQWLCTKHHAAKFPDEGALSWCGGSVKALPSGSDAARSTRYPEDVEDGTLFELLATEAPPVLPTPGSVEVEYPDSASAKEDLDLGGGNGNPIMIVKCKGEGWGADRLKPGMVLTKVNGEGCEVFQKKMLRRVLAVSPPVQLTFNDPGRAFVPCDLQRMVISVGVMRPLLVPHWVNAAVEDSKFTRVIRVAGRDARFPLDVPADQITSTVKRLIPAQMLGHQCPLLGRSAENVPMSCEFNLMVPLVAFRRPFEEKPNVHDGDGEMEEGSKRASEVALGLRLTGTLKALSENDVAESQARQNRQSLDDDHAQGPGTLRSPPATSISPTTSSNDMLASQRAGYRKGMIVDSKPSIPGRGISPRNTGAGAAPAVSQVVKLGRKTFDSDVARKNGEPISPKTPMSARTPKEPSSARQRQSANQGMASSMRTSLGLGASADRASLRNTRASQSGLPPVVCYEWRGVVTAGAEEREVIVNRKTVEELLTGLEAEFNALTPLDWTTVSLLPQEPMLLSSQQPPSNLVCPSCNVLALSTLLDLGSPLNKLPNIGTCSYCSNKTFAVLYCPRCDESLGRCDLCFGNEALDSIVTVSIKLGVEQNDRLNADISRQQILQRRATGLSAMLGVAPQIIALNLDKNLEKFGWDIELILTHPAFSPPRYIPKEVRYPSPLLLFLELQNRWRNTVGKKWPLAGYEWLGSGVPRMSEAIMCCPYDLQTLPLALDTNGCNNTFKGLTTISRRVFHHICSHSKLSDDGIGPSDFAAHQMKVLAKLNCQDFSEAAAADVILQAFFSKKDDKNNRDATINEDEFLEAQEEIIEVLGIDRQDFLRVLKEVEEERIEDEKAFKLMKADAATSALIGLKNIIPPPDFFAAIKEGDVQKVKMYLLRGANANCYYEGECAIHCAGRMGFADICDFLLNFRADPQKLDDCGKSPLDVACRTLVEDKAGSASVCNTLLKHGGQLVQSVESVLHEAVKENPEAAINSVNILIDAKADTQAVDIKGRTACDIAVETKATSNVLWSLVRTGVQLKKQADKALFAALQKPSTRGLSERAPSRTSNASIISKESRVKTGGEVGEQLRTSKAQTEEILLVQDTPAVGERDSEIQCLLEAKANIYSEDDEKTALQLALEVDASDAIIESIATETSAAGMLDMPDDDGNSALDTALSTGRWSACVQLVGQGAKLISRQADSVFLALEQKNPNLVRSMIVAAADLNAKNAKGQRPLTLVSEMDNAELAQVILETGKDIDLIQRDSFQNTALHISAELGGFQVAEMLVKHATMAMINLNVENYKGHTPMDACLAKNLAFPNSWATEIPTLLGGAGFTLNKLGRSGLFEALRREDLSTLKALISSKVDVNKETIDNHGSYAIHVAAESGSLDMLKLLLKCKSDHNLKKLFDGDTPLHLAVRQNREAWARSLLSVPKLSVEALNLAKRSPLDEAIAVRSEILAGLLINRGAKLSEYARKNVLFEALLGGFACKDLDITNDIDGKNGASPTKDADKATTSLIELALKGGAELGVERGLPGEKDIFELSSTLGPPSIKHMGVHLLGEPATPLPSEGSKPTSFHQQPLTLAAWLGELNAVNLMLEYKADFSWRNDFGRSALHYAAPSCVDVLCRAKADPLSQDRMLRTPVMAAMELRDNPTAVSVIEAILKAANCPTGSGGAPAGLNMVDIDGDTVFHLGARHGRTEALALLSRHAAYDARKQNQHGQTAEQVALTQGHGEAAQQLARPSPPFIKK